MSITWKSGQTLTHIKSIIQDIVRKTFTSSCKFKKNKKMLNKFNIREIYAHNISGKFYFFINGHPFYDQINHSIVKLHWVTFLVFFWCLPKGENIKKFQANFSISQQNAEICWISSIPCFKWKKREHSIELENRYQ